MGKNSGVLIVILLLVGGIFAFMYFNKNVDANSDNMLSYTLRDANGNPIPNNVFSIVNDIPGVSSMDIAINVQNTGSTPLNCSVSGITPTAFNSAITKTSKVVQPGNAISWPSTSISVAQFESMTQPVTFSAVVTCTYVSAGSTISLSPQTGSIQMRITSDAAGSFQVGLGSNAGGVAPVCGNGICESGESSSNCGPDCAVSSNVKFRATNAALTTAGNEIAFTTTCGNALTKAGQLSGALARNGRGTSGCATYMPSQNYGNKIMDLANKISVTVNSYTYNTAPSLWQSTSMSTVYCVCANDATSANSVFTCFNTGTAAPTISNLATSVDSTKEISC